MGRSSGDSSIMPTGKPQSTIYGPVPTEDLQMANKEYVDVAGTLKAVKSADETITSDTVLQNDTDLVIPLLPNRHYGFMCVLKVNSHATPDWKSTFAAIVGATGFFNIGTVTDLFSTPQAFGTNVTLATDATDQMNITYGDVTMGATAGNLQLRWAQVNSSVEDTTLLEGSYIIAWLLD